MYAVQVVQTVLRWSPRSSSLRSRRRTLLKEGLAADRLSEFVGDIVGWTLAVGVEEMQVVGTSHWEVVVAGWGTAEPAAVLVGTGLKAQCCTGVVVQMHACHTERTTAAEAVGSRHRSRVAVARMGPHFRCRRSRQLEHLRLRLTGYWDISLKWGVGWQVADRTLHRLDCMYAIGAPRACGRNIVQPLTASHVGPVKYRACS